MNPHEQDILRQMGEGLPSLANNGNMAQRQRATQQIRKILTKLSPKTTSFKCTGVCTLRVTTIDEGEVDYDIPIRSVPFSELSGLLQEAIPDPPRTPHTNPETLQWEMVVDTQDPEYQRQIMELNTRFQDRMILRMLDVPLEDAHGNIVLQPGQPIEDEDAALQALAALDFTRQHKQQLQEACENLSKAQEQREAALRQKK